MDVETDSDKEWFVLGEGSREEELVRARYEFAVLVDEMRPNLRAELLANVAPAAEALASALAKEGPVPPDPEILAEWRMAPLEAAADSPHFLGRLREFVEGGGITSLADLLDIDEEGFPTAEFRDFGEAFFRWAEDWGLRNGWLLEAALGSIIRYLIPPDPDAPVDPDAGDTTHPTLAWGLNRSPRMMPPDKLPLPVGMEESDPRYLAKIRAWSMALIEAKIRGGAPGPPKRQKRLEELEVAFRRLIRFQIGKQRGPETAAEDSIARLSDLPEVVGDRSLKKSLKVARDMLGMSPDQPARRRIGPN